MVINRQKRIKTRSGKVKMISENNLVLKPGSQMPSVVGMPDKFFERCLSFRSNCFRNVLDTTVTIETKAFTPFFLSGPRFSFGVFRYLTMAEESWFDVMITAARSEEKSVTGGNCLEHSNVHESIFQVCARLFKKGIHTCQLGSA